MEELQILNGIISPSFSEEIYEYEVVVDSTTFSLDLNYTLKDDYSINIIGNDYFDPGNNIVILEIYNDKEAKDYTFNIKTNEVETVTSEVETIEPIEVEETKNILYDIKTPLISSVTFLLILILFCIIFRKKK